MHWRKDSRYVSRHSLPPMTTTMSTSKWPFNSVPFRQNLRLSHCGCLNATPSCCSARSAPMWLQSQSGQSLPVLDEPAPRGRSRTVSNQPSFTGCSNGRSQPTSSTGELEPGMSSWKSWQACKVFCLAIDMALALPQEVRSLDAETWIYLKA